MNAFINHTSRVTGTLTLKMRHIAATYIKPVSFMMKPMYSPEFVAQR